MLKPVAIGMAIAGGIAGAFLLTPHDQDVAVLAMLGMAGAFGLGWVLVRERRRRQIRKINEMRDSALW